MTVLRVIACFGLLGPAFACGDDGSSEESGSVGEADGSSGASESSTATSTASTSGSGTSTTGAGESSGSGDSSSSASTGSEGGGSEGGGSEGASEGGGDVCACTQGDLPECPDGANCQDEGAQCCDAMDRVLECVFNDIGTVWIPQHPPCK